MIMKYLDDAVATCETLLSQPETSTETIPWLEACQTVGSILASMGFVEESHTWQSMAFDAAPDTTKFYVESERVYSQCEMWDRAVYFCQRSLDCQPENTEVYRHLANLYHRLGDYKSESETMHQLLQKQPEQASASAHHQLGKLMMSQGNWSKAARCYQQSIARDPQFVEAYYSLATLWDKQGKHDKTIALLQQLVEQMPEAADAHYRLGRAYRLARQLDMAIECFRRALQLDPHLHWAHMGLLNSLMQLKQWDETIEICQGIVHFVGEFPWAYCFMGNALAQKGDWLGAAEAHRKAFDLRGWQQCIARRYDFTHSWFSESIPLWERHLLPLNSDLASRASLQILSVGSGDGSAVCWLVDEILQRADDRLLCVTAGASDLFRQNVARLAEPEKFELKPGEPLAELESVAAERVEAGAGFDVIYLRSDRKQADELQRLLATVWPLLNPNGLMFIKDYLWQHPTDSSLASKVGIDAFKGSLGDQVQQLHQSHQVIWKKVD